MEIFFILLQESNGHVVVRDARRDQHVPPDEGERHQGRAPEVSSRADRVLSEGKAVPLFASLDRAIGAETE